MADEAIQLYTIFLLTIFVLILLLKLREQAKEHKREVLEAGEKARKDSKTRQRSIIKGDQLATLAPLFMGSVNSISEVRYLGGVVDFIGFKGLDKEDEIDIKFIEVKSGKSRLTKDQKRVKEAVDAKRVKWVEVRANLKDMGMEITEETSGESE